MLFYYLLATVLASAAGFFGLFPNFEFLNSFGVLETASAALIVYSCVGFNQPTGKRIALSFSSSFIIATACGILVCYLAQGVQALTTPNTWISLSKILHPYLVALPVTLCLKNKKDPITIAIVAISVSAVFILATTCLEIFAAYDHFSFKAFEFYISDMNNEYLKIYEEYNMGILAQKVYVSFLTRMSVSLLPGTCIMLAVIQIFIVIAALKALLKEKLLEYNKGPWAVSLSTISAIINIISIIAFMSCFFSTSIDTFSAVAGNVMLILAPASSIIGFAFLMLGFRKGGLMNIFFGVMPILMLFVAPQLAIIYISFIGSSNIIFTRIASAMLKIK